MKKIISLFICFAFIIGISNCAENYNEDNAPAVTDEDINNNRKTDSSDKKEIVLDNNNSSIEEKEKIEGSIITSNPKNDNNNTSPTANIDIIPTDEPVDKKFACLTDNSTMHETILKYINRYKLNGVSLVIAKGNKIIYSYNHGFLDTGKSKPVNNESLLRTASVTKFITAIGLLKLYDEGKIKLDEDIGKYLGIKIANPRHPKSPITVRQLMSHTSSIENGSSFNNNSKSLDKILGLDDECKKNYSNSIPGTRYKYKNLNGGLFGALIEAISKESLQSYMQREIFEPLKMKAYYNLSLVNDIDLDNVSSIFMRDFTLLRRPVTILKNAKQDYNNSSNPLHNYNISIGSLWTNANYLIRPLMMLAGKGELDGKRYLKEETVNMMIADQSKIPGSSVTLENGKYGLSVERMLKLGKLPWFGHQGRFEGTLACAYFQPDTGLCIALVCNRWDNRMKDGIALFSTRLVQSLEEWNESKIIQ